VWAPVRPNMLNMPKSAAALYIMLAKPNVKKKTEKSSITVDCCDKLYTDVKVVHVSLKLFDWCYNQHKKI